MTNVYVLRRTLERTKSEIEFSIAQVRDNDEMADIRDELTQARNHLATALGYLKETAAEEMADYGIGSY